MYFLYGKAARNRKFHDPLSQGEVIYGFKVYKFPDVRAGVPVLGRDHIRHIVKVN